VEEEKLNQQPKTGKTDLENILLKEVVRYKYDLKRVSK
jgi:hypothetical protein